MNSVITGLAKYSVNCVTMLFGTLWLASVFLFPLFTGIIYYSENCFIPNFTYGSGPIFFRFVSFTLSYKFSLNVFFIIVCLIIASLLFIEAIFSAPPLRLSEPLTEYSKQGLENTALHDQQLPTPLHDFAIEEYKTAVAEINMRIEQENGWYKDKFILVGGYWLAFSLTFSDGMYRQDRHELSTDVYKYF